MKRAIQLAIRLYPKTWRDRYAAELEALIADDPRSGGTAALVDLLKGAITMKLTRASTRGLVIGFALVGCVIATASWALIPNIYRSTGTAVVPGSTPATAIRESYLKAVSSEEIRALAARHGLEHSDVQQIRQRITFHFVERKTPPVGNFFSISFDSLDPKTSQDVAHELLDRIARTIEHSTMFDVPGLPKTPLYPYLPPMPFAGILGGATLGLILAGLATRIRRRQARST